MLDERAADPGAMRCDAGRAELDGRFPQSNRRGGPIRTRALRRPTNGMPELIVRDFSRGSFATVATHNASTVRFYKARPSLALWFSWHVFDAGRGSGFLHDIPGGPVWPT